MTVLPDFSTGYHSRNGGGDIIRTDGDLPIVDLTGLGEPTGAELVATAPAALAAVEGRRPSQTVFGVAVTAVRGLVYLVLGGLSIVGEQVLAGAAIADPTAGVVAGTVFAVAGLTDLGLSAATFAGRNWARLLVCILSVLAIGFTFVSRSVGNEHGPLHAALLPLAISVLVLLALSSDAARNFATGQGRARPLS